MLILRYVLAGLFLLVTVPVTAQDYSFDVEQYEKSPFEYSGNLELNPILGDPDRDSRFYRLQFLNRNDEGVIEDYDAELDLDGSYTLEPVTLVGSVQIAQRYNEFQEWEDDNNVFELYGEYRPYETLSLSLGRRTYKWGTGYVWNPVNFAGRQKDVDDVSEALKGYDAAGLHWVSSFPGNGISSLALDVVYLPDRKDVNEEFLPGTSDSLIGRLHTLVHETDLSGYLMYNDAERSRVGADFAYNLESHWEIHGEYTHRLNQRKQYVNASGNLESDTSDRTNYLIGTRYLTEDETTVILEYFYRGGAYSREETENLYDSIDSVLASPNPSDVKQNRGFVSLYNEQIQMKENVYLRVYHPEPFDVLYFTPGFFALHNLVDDSTNLTLDAKYNRYESLEFHLLYAHLFGDDGTQYGEKIIDDRLELRARYYF